MPKIICLIFANRARESEQGNAPKGFTCSLNNYDRQSLEDSHLQRNYSKHEFCPIRRKAIAIDNDLRGTLRNFGLKVGMVGTVRFEARITELVENLPDLAALVEPLLIVRRTLREQFSCSTKQLRA